VFILVVGPAFAQDDASRSITVQPGDTFDVELSVDSSFHSWELVNYDVRTLSLIAKQPPSNVGNYRFVFETLRPGDADLHFRRNLNTAISTEELEEHFVTVRIQERGEGRSEPEPPELIDQPDEQPPSPEPSPTENQEGTAPIEDHSQPSPEQPSPETPDQPENQSGPNADPDYWGRSNELIETGYYEEARELIQERVGRTAGETRQRWMNLEAQSYMEEENYEEAIAVWENMIEEFKQGPQARWLLSVAEAHRENGARDQAELALLEVRHHHQESSQWPEAMTRLARIAQDKDNPDRARRILEEARSRLDNRRHPDILMKLARIYDQYPSTRNYYKAVKLYQQAARGYDASDTRGEEARKRASYLRDNFLNFGTQ
jgi:TolA-binding protein